LNDYLISNSHDAKLTYVVEMLWVEGNNHGSVIVDPATQLVPCLFRSHDVTELHKNLAVCVTHDHSLFNSFTLDLTDAYHRHGNFKTDHISKFFALGKQVVLDFLSLSFIKEVPDMDHVQNLNHSARRSAERRN
jgi:hypothetical protein